MVINVIFKNESGFYKGDVYPLPYLNTKEDIENYICAVCDEHTELFMWYGDDGIVYECITKGDNMSKHQEMIDELGLREDEDLLFMASIIRLILDERGVFYPSRQSENVYEGGISES